jgi:hypothetical protein
VISGKVESMKQRSKYRELDCNHIEKIEELKRIYEVDIDEKYSVGKTKKEYYSKSGF